MGTVIGDCVYIYRARQTKKFQDLVGNCSQNKKNGLHSKCTPAPSERRGGRGQRAFP